MCSAAQPSSCFPALVDAACWRRFALFDALVMRRCWRFPALWCGCFLLAGLLCLGTGQPMTPLFRAGQVLFMLGFGLPLGMGLPGWFRLNRRCRMLGTGRLFYMVYLREDALKIQLNFLERPIRWSQLFYVIRTKHCLYFYLYSRQSYLLPICDGSDLLWRFLQKRLPPKKLCDLQKVL